MSDSPKMSRRDWFRLKHRLPGEEEFASLRTPESTTLRPVEQPPNHDGLNLDELPPVKEAILNNDEVTALFSDIQEHATDVQLMQRRNSGRSQQPQRDMPKKLEIAKQAFLRGEVTKLQIRYRWNQTLWIDTLSQHHDQVRLVRIQHANM